MLELLVFFSSFFCAKDVGLHLMNFSAGHCIVFVDCSCTLDTCSSPNGIGHEIKVLVSACYFGSTVNLKMSQV